MSAEHHPLPKKNGHGGGYEKQDVGFRFAMTFVVGLIAAVVVALIITAWFYRLLLPSPPRQEQVDTAPRRLPPAPVLQADPARDMQKYRESENLKASSYGWVDQNKGIVRVPVQRAMEMVAEQGLPQWQAPQANQERRQ